MKVIEAKIKGISPLLMHALPMVQVDGFEKSLEEQAELAAYRDPDTKRLMCRPLLYNGAWYRGLLTARAKAVHRYRRLLRRA